MARTGISFEDVRNAAESLLGRGLNPTIQRVRELLGTGSNTTISEHLKNWQLQLAETPKIVLPPAVPEAVAPALDAFWKIAVQHAEAAFDEQRALAAQTVSVAERAREAAIAAQRQLETEAEQLRRQLETAQTAARDLADRLLVEQERRAAAESAIQAAEQRVQAAADTLAQIRAETAARVTQLETVLQQTRTDTAKQLTEAQQRFEVERQRGEANEVRLSAALDQLRAEQNAERQDWNRRETVWREQQAAQHHASAELKANLAAAGERQNALVAESQAIRLSLEITETSYLQTVREAESLRGELKAVRADRERLQKQLEKRPASPSGSLQTPDAPRPPKTRKIRS